MMRVRTLVPAAAILLLVSMLSDCTGDGSGPGTQPSPLPRGGTLRVGTLHDAPGIYDPQRSYMDEPQEILRCCLVRTLFSYNGLPGDQGGSVARPDLAATTPEVSSDGLTWTIRLKHGLHFAPPLEDTEIVAADVVRAVRRLALVTNERGCQTCGYPFYYSVIEGFDAFRAGETDTISGLETPDDHTLVVHVTEPTGDLPYRFAMPATSPIPADPFHPDASLGTADGHGRDYGSFLVASGPYMLEGSEDLDFSLPPTEQARPSGYTPSTFGTVGFLSAEILRPGSLVLVRNPSWDAGTDPLRAAYADRIQIQVLADPKRASSFVRRGAVDALLYVPFEDQPALDLERYRSDPGLEDRLLRAERNGLFYMAMNVAHPPFDDLHVRRALVLALDRQALGEINPMAQAFEVPWHLAPNSLEGSLLADWRPDWMSDATGDTAAARAEMRLSRYDHDGDGRCDDAVCEGVPVGGAAFRPRTTDFGDSALVRDAAAKIGIDLHVTLYRSPRAFYAASFSGRTAMGASVLDGWALDYPSASGFLAPLFQSGSPYNQTFLGATDDQVRDLDLGTAKVPNVDERIDRCLPLPAWSDQIQCWGELDQYLMTDVVPVVPLAFALTETPVSARVVNAAICQFTGLPALDRIALAPE